MDDLLSEEDRAKQEKEQAAAQRQAEVQRMYDEDFKFLLRQKEVRAMCWRFLGECGIFQQSFSGEFPLHTAFKEGARSKGLWLMNEILRLDENSYRLMHIEGRALAKYIEDGNGNG